MAQRALDRTETQPVWEALLIQRRGGLAKYCAPSWPKARLNSSQRAMRRFSLCSARVSMPPTMVCRK